MPAQAETDRLIDEVSEQIELLALDNPAPELLRQMVQCLADSRRRTRVQLADIFGEIGEAATPFLLEGLATAADSTTRVACCNALTNIGDADAVPELIVALRKDADISVKGAAAGALAKIGAPAFEPLKRVLTDGATSESCKGQAAWAIASMSHEVSEQLYASLNDPCATVRVAMVGAIAKLAQSQSTQSQPSQSDSAPLSLLIKALKDDSTEVRIEAAANLARLNAAAVYEPLVDGLKDDDPDVRKAIVLALGKLANPEAIAAINPLQQDPEPAVQRVANLVITQLTAR